MIQTAKEARDRTTRSRNEYKEIMSKVRDAAAEGRGRVKINTYQLEGELVELLRHNGFEVIGQTIRWA